MLAVLTKLWEPTQDFGAGQSCRISLVRDGRWDCSKKLTDTAHRVIGEFSLMGSLLSYIIQNALLLLAVELSKSVTQNQLRGTHSGLAIFPLAIRS